MCWMFAGSRLLLPVSTNFSYNDVIVYTVVKDMQSDYGQQR